MTDITEPADVPELQPAIDRPERRELVFELDKLELRDSGDPEKKHIATIRGHAAVFNSLSEDLGGFREIIHPGFFRDALRRKQDVRLLLNHDPNFVLARTASGTLELREDDKGLHVFAEADKRISWVQDLHRSMQRGDIDQMSFAFTLKDDGDDWAVSEDGTVVRSLLPDGADGLYDSSIVTYPAYRATHVDMRSLLDQAVEQGRLPAEVAAGAEPGIAPPEVGVEEAADQGGMSLAELKHASRQAREQARRDFLRLTRETLT